MYHYIINIALLLRLEMDLENLLEEYYKCVDICFKIDYTNKKTISDNNRAVKKMYAILNEIKQNNKEDIKYFYELLDNEIARKWFSYQLLELFKVDQKIEKKALKIIKKLSKKEIGEKYWLNEYKKRKNKKIL
jgi:hypothetical protein